MPRRKQAKPQHTKSEEQPPEAADGSPQDMPGDRDGEMSSKRCRTEEIKICEKCCAEFVLSGFLEHQKNCTNNPPVLIMNDSEGTVPPEIFSEAPLGTSQDGRTFKDIQAEGCTSSVEKREGKMDAELVGGMYPKIEPPLTLAAPSLSSLPKPEVPNSSDTISFLAGSLNSIRAMLEWFMCVSQQQFQLLTEQIATMAPHTLDPSTAAAADPLKALGTHVSQRLSAAVPVIGPKAGSQSPSLESLEQGKLPRSNTGIAAASSLAAGLSSSCPLEPEGSQDLPSSISPFTNPLLPQSSGSVIFQNPLPAICSIMDSSKKGQGKPPNISMSKSKPNAEEPFFKHKCKFCGKVFGNDSALQIHLRSHINRGRPYICIICGNHFTTKGDFKVHVQSHKDEYSSIKMDPYPVPENLDNVPTSTGIPYGMSVPLDESNLILDSKPLLRTLPTSAASSAPQTISSLAGIKESLPGMFSSELQSRHSPQSEGGSSSSGAVGHELGMEQSVSSPQAPYSVSIFHVSGSNKQGSETSKLQQLVENTDKSTADLNECLICHRVLSCQSSLVMHYRTHTGERPFKCKICGRAFSTKGNLNTHYSLHGVDTSSKMQQLCPICQKKFTNAMVLQQHIRMHMARQIPSTPMPESPCDSAEVDPSAPEKNRDIGRPEEMVKSIDVGDDLDSQDGPRSSSKPPTLCNAQSESPAAFSRVTALENQMKVVSSSLNLQRQSSLKSNDKGSAERHGMTNDSSWVVGGADCQNGWSPAASEATPLSPGNSQPKSLSSKSPAFNSQEDSGTGSESSIPAAFVRAPPALMKMELPSNPGKWHICTTCGKISTSRSALQIHERMHTGEKPFACTICGKAFTTKGNLKVHVGTHVWNNSARQGRRLSIDSPMALLGNDPKKVQEMFPKDMVPWVSIDPAVWNQHGAVLSAELAVQTNEILVIQSGALPVPVAGGSPLNSTPASKGDTAQAGAASAQRRWPAGSVPDTSSLTSWRRRTKSPVANQDLQKEHI